MSDQQGSLSTSPITARPKPVRTATTGTVRGRTSPGPGEQNGDTRPQKRARKAINCEPCRNSKLKCDRYVSQGGILEEIFNQFIQEPSMLILRPARYATCSNMNLQWLNLLQERLLCATRTEGGPMETIMCRVLRIICEPIPVTCEGSWCSALSPKVYPHRPSPRDSPTATFY